MTVRNRVRGEGIRQRGNSKELKRTLRLMDVCKRETDRPIKLPCSTEPTAVAVQKELAF